ncbi:MAG: hypothetical protein ABFS32_10170 [Bacteroidota bacterium]
MRFYKNILITLLFAAFFYEYSQSQSVEKQLFNSDEILHIRISMNVKEVISERDTASRKYHKAIFTYEQADGEEVSQKIKIKVRGNNRANPDVCSFPPLKLNFNKSNADNSIFAGQDKLKLVTHCSGKSLYEEYTLREYYVYKLLQLITPYSFKVRLCRVIYDDTNGKFKPTPHYGFIIEDLSHLTKRHDIAVFNGRVRNQDACSRVELDRVTLFEYLIGNLDWSIPYRHNFKIVVDKKRSALIPVPYDFDLTGIVNKTNALPPPSFEITSVRERIFRGLCRVEGGYDPTVQHFKDIKPAIYALYEDSEYLSERSIKSTLKYLDSFYKILDNPKALRQKIERACWAEHKHLYK